MNRSRFQSITANYPRLRLAVLGDFCLDRYLEIDPEKSETSIETCKTVYNVMRTRSQPGAAGTILNNLSALGVGEIFAAGFCGDDAEGWELRRALQNRSGARLDYFLTTQQRRTFTYTKPLLIRAGAPPEELNRLDFKNWEATPESVSAHFERATGELAARCDAIILLDQVDCPETGVITRTLLRAIAKIRQLRPELLILADSRRGLREFPPVTCKMNRAELERLSGDADAVRSLAAVRVRALELAAKNQRLVFVTLAEEGILAADPSGNVFHQAALPRRGETDIVGAGDAVTANLAAALAAGASAEEAVKMANAAASIVIHQLGTTGAATVPEIERLLSASPYLNS